MEGTISKKALVVWEIVGLLAAMLVGGLVWLVIPERSTLWYLLLWLDGLAAVLCEFLYLPLRYLNEQYSVNEYYVEYQRGFFICARTRILKRSILYVTVIKTPLSMLLRTRTLLICSMGARMIIPFLPVQAAEELLREITPKAPALQPRMFERKGSRHE